MDMNGFWDLVERSAQQSSSRRERLDWLEDHLARLPSEEIVDYEACFTLCANRACTWDMYAVCWTIIGSGSSDGFEYFVTWLISLGRDSYEKVTECPDRILELPQVQRLSELSRNYCHERTSVSADGTVRLLRLTRVRQQFWPNDDWPEFELFAYVPGKAYARALGDDEAHPGEAVAARGITRVFPFLTNGAEPEGEAWDFGDEAEFTRRLPRLVRHYAATDHPWTPWPSQPFWGDERTRAWSFHDRTARERRMRHFYG
ncbi:DUF4240 domain-containing protein [Nonomuraea sp. NPDC050790]|uniref:DUF4240 domain-containing protein n=1 Tax=Nonomuraea sp. NPDC050790 TaxID=3364371 RepID=UPI0037A331E9